MILLPFGGVVPVKRIPVLAVAILSGLLCAGAAQAAVITVTSSGNSGTGTLRQALADAADGDTINFAFAGATTIGLSSRLTLNKSLTIIGPGAGLLAISGQNTVRVLLVDSGSSTITGLAITHGYDDSNNLGVGIELKAGSVLFLDQCLVQNHAAFTGGAAIEVGAGIFLESGATLVVNRSQIRNNSAGDGYGGGVLNYGAISIYNSVLTGNSAYDGGGIQSGGGTIKLVNTTVSGNHTGVYGAIRTNLTAMQIVNCTISDNNSDYLVAGLYSLNSTVNLRNTVIAGNLSGDPQGNTDLLLGASNTVTSEGNNLIGSQGSGTYTWQASDLVGTEAAKLSAGLGALADYGGYVPAHQPGAGSLAMNPSDSNNAPFVDSRGFLRVNTAERGACEYSSLLPVALPCAWHSPTSFTAYWMPVAGVADYALDLSTDVTFATYVSSWSNSLVGNATQAEVAGLTPGQTYYYRVRAVNGIHQSYHSNTIGCIYSTPLPTATGTPGNLLAGVDLTGKLFLTFPNPARDQVRFLLAPEHPVRVRIELYNLSGEPVAVVEDSLPAGKGAVVWNCRAAAPGMYLARILLDGNEIGKAKVAVTH